MEKASPQLPGYQLPTQPQFATGRWTEGFFTPTQDLMPQVLSIPPKRVLPIIFLPGIMGTNLRMSTPRQALLEKGNNIAWRPENKTESIALSRSSPGRRQNQLDASTTEVDEYDPGRNLTGNSKETADQRHENAKADFKYGFDVGIDTPLLSDDPIGAKMRRTKLQKARERGWGEVFFGSYGNLLQMCEQRLNAAFSRGQLDPWWKQIVDVSPATWQANPQPPLQSLDEETLREACKGCWFPVHAVGYNWLKPNRDSGIRVAERISALMERYKSQGFQCEKVIVITHSMGGLVARALIHPKMGNFHDKILGIVHGVMPAIGAAATYKRMRCGFEDPGLLSMSPTTSLTAKVLGNTGPDVTAVLGNAQGGLELLPSQAYGNGWLQVRHKGRTIMSFPEKGDPYEEIYKLRGKWYGLLRDEWINPAGQALSGIARTNSMLNRAKRFHLDIGDTYHSQSFAHYGADPSHAAWRNVVWALDDSADTTRWEHSGIQSDDLQGELRLAYPSMPGHKSNEGSALVVLQPPADPGDQTVPLHSAEHQLRSGKFKGIFRQTGYEHQNSYQHQGALHSTLYSLVRIAQTMKWNP